VLQICTLESTGLQHNGELLCLFDLKNGKLNCNGADVCPYREQTKLANFQACTMWQTCRNLYRSVQTSRVLDNSRKAVGRWPTCQTLLFTALHPLSPAMQRIKFGYRFWNRISTGFNRRTVWQPQGGAYILNRPRCKALLLQSHAVLPRHFQPHTSITRRCAKTSQ
jgi:hypothetical protein